jgi:hypothetical protein
MGKEMKPCPLCGGKVMLLYGTASGWPPIWCPECETIWRPVVHADEIVTDWWNRREGE